MENRPRWGKHINVVPTGGVSTNGQTLNDINP